MYTIVPLTQEHRKPVIDIFNYFITNSFAAYPETPFGYEFFDQLVAMGRGYPAFVALGPSGEAAGFAMLRPYHPVPVFRRTAELSYFLLPEHTRQGVGTLFLQTFLDEAGQRGLTTFLASISSLNEQSLAFHRKHGFQECGRFCRVGTKFGQDFDVVWMQRMVTME